MGFIGGALRAFQGDPTFNTIHNVKNADLQKQIDASLTGFQTLKDSSDASLSDYISKYLAGGADAASRTGQEIGSVDRYYNGEVDNALAGMRTQRQTAVLSAADRAQKASLAGVHGSMLANDGGGSSYDSRLALKNYTDISTNAALDNANQQKGDYMFSLQQQQANLGRRQSLADALTARTLVPSQLRNQQFGQQLGYLGSIENMDQANNFYGLQQHKTGLDKWAAFGDAADQGIMNAASIAGSVMGMGGMGGGAPGGGAGGGGGGGSGIGATAPSFSPSFSPASYATAYQPTGQNYSSNYSGGTSYTNSMGYNPNQWGGFGGNYNN